MQGLQLIGLANTILIQITPNPQSIVFGITTIELSITIAIKLGKSFKTMSGLFAIQQYSLVAKQLCPRLNESAVITIPHQKTII